jgi:hypothetical protein
MSNRMWESLVEHAKTCVLSGKHYIYYSSDGQSVGAIFNNIYEFTGLIADEFISAENLTENQRVSVFWLPSLNFLRWHLRSKIFSALSNIWIGIIELTISFLQYHQICC